MDDNTREVILKTLETVHSMKKIITIFVGIYVGIHLVSVAVEIYVKTALT